MFDFDEEIDRKGTHCAKWEFILEDGELRYNDHADLKYGDERLLP